MGRRRGFSVLEVLVAATVMIVVISSGYHLMRGGRQVFDTSVKGMDLNQEASKAMISLGMDIRGASYADLPNLVDVKRVVRPTDTDLADFLKLALVRHTPDFETPAGGDRNLEAKETKVAFEFRKVTDATGPYILTRQAEGDPQPRIVAKNIQFGYFKRVPFWETKWVGGHKVNVYGTGPSVVQVHVDLSNPDQSGRAAGYKVAFDTAFQIRGCRLK